MLYAKERFSRKTRRGGTGSRTRFFGMHQANGDTTAKSYLLRRRFRARHEDAPGDAWRAVFARGWPGWSAWSRQRGGEDGPSVKACRLALRRHMPEMESLWDRLVEAVDGDDSAARFLSFWTPPRYIVHCSQIASVDAAGPYLIRNYDLDPELNEATLLRTAWRGRRVMGMVEGLCGLADGVNDVGLAASLTFGGRVQTGPGFGVPLIMRYVLEMCADVRDGVAALRAIPCHMSYNITLTDRSGARATVFLAPDRPAMARSEPFATNHQLNVEWPRHGRVSRTRERYDRLAGLSPPGGVDEAAMRAAFLSDPVFSPRYADGFGTVYTAVHRPAQGTTTLWWLNGDPLSAGLASAEPAAAEVTYTNGGSTSRLYSPDEAPPPNGGPTTDDGDAWRQVCAPAAPYLP